MLAAAACTENATAPGVCPTFCPSGSISIKDTIFGAIIERDSSFRGYLQGYQATLMTAADSPGVVDSRSFFTTETMITRIAPKAGDTTTVPIVVDSVRLRFIIAQRDKQATNLGLKLFQLPITVDSTSDFASLDPSFTAPPLDSVNITNLLAQAKTTDTAVIRFWSDSVRIDSAGNVLRVQADSSLLLFLKLDTLQAPLSPPDSGRLAYGIRVAADSFARLSLVTEQTSAGAGPQLHWYYHYTIPDTISTKPDSVVYADRVATTRFDSFVFDPPSAAIDSNLAVGGVPSARSLLRVAMPKFLHDSIDVVRATLILVPVSPVRGIARDSFAIEGRNVTADLGAKSPLGTTFATTFIHVGSADTVQLELTNLVRAWSLDTTQVTSLFLRQLPEAASYAQARFYSSRAPAFRPALHVTYVHRFQFGGP
ncbi:MAG: hypothetical protein AUH41_11780 [Gemmatimonadetes bacterium 13_1_40CM_66_11]|nr:MAG: hypothetical protein AUH41_11780 [Gemmatimonadetes bacterium 13_1_40CM_66_11]